MDKKESSSEPRQSELDTERTLSSIETESSDTQHISSHGLTMFTASLFVAGEMIGSGVLALPRAVIDIGWVGLPLMVLLGICAGYGGTRLAACWTILEERYPEYKGRVRDPYPTIGYRAYGAWARVLVRVSIYITLFGTAVVYLLLIASMLQDIVNDLAQDMVMSLCTWSLVTGALLCPVTWLGSPKDFWLAAMGALVTMTLVCIFGLAQMIRWREESLPLVTHNSSTLWSFFLAFGTVLFSFGGASTFPTVQNDMKDRSQFVKSVSVAFLVIIILYIMVSMPGYILIGDVMKSNFLEAIHHGPLVLTSRILIVMHLVLAYIIVLNPVCQDLEEFLRIPHVFGWKRCLCRTIIMVCVTFVAESIPHFSKILALVGASTVTLLTFVLPPVFYMRLCDQKDPYWTSRSIPVWIRVFLWEMVFIGVFGGSLSTYSAIVDMISGSTFVKPCYV